jgi:chitin disaccharide deacetylase
MGRPISVPETVPTLVDENGKFYRNGPLLERLSSLHIDEVKREWGAQIERFIQAAGRKPDHIDSHHHSSYFTAGLFRAMLELAQEYDCAIRYPFNEDWPELGETSRHAPALMQEFSPCRPDVIIGSFYDKGATLENILHILNNLNDGTSELMCHPGHVDQVFAERESIYNYQRERELEILVDPSVRQAILSNGIELVTFANL